MARALGAINNTEPTKANMTTIDITNVNLKCIFFQDLLLLVLEFVYSPDKFETFT